MTIQVTCPSCSGEFLAPSFGAGKKAKCPRCASVIEIPASQLREEILEAEEALPSSPGSSDLGIEAPKEAAAGEDRRPCPMCGEMIQRSAIKCRFCGEVLDRSMIGILGSRVPDTSDPRWKKVRTGLATLYYSMIVVILTAILIGILAAILGSMNAGGPNADPPALFLFVIGLGGLVILGAAFGVLIGYAYCASVPEVSGARGFAVGAVVCLLGNILLSMAGGIAKIEVLNLLGSFVSLVGWVLFLLFIRNAAAYLGNSDLSTSTVRFLIFGATMVVGAFVLGVVAGIGQAPALLGVIGLGVVIAALVGFVWFLRLIQKLMTTIDERTSAI